MDFSYISGETFGDHQLESELLELFLAQARRLIPGLPARPDQDEAAHLLKGSALAAGAARVAAAVSAYGEAPRSERCADGILYAELVGAFEETSAAIEKRLAFLKDKTVQ